MTENAFPFGGTAPQPPADDEPAGGDSRRRTMLIAGGVAGVLVLIAAAYFFLFKGSGGGTTGATGLVASAHHPTAAAAGGSTPSPAASANLEPSTYNGVIGRDPFTPLYVQPTAAPSAAPVAPVAAASGGTAAAATPAPVVTSTSTTVTNAPVEPTYVYTLRSSATSATFKVGYSDGTHKTYTAKKGETFASFFSPQSIQPHVVTLQVGDGGNIVDAGLSYKKRAVCTGGATSPLMCSNPTTP